MAYKQQPFTSAASIATNLYRLPQLPRLFQLLHHLINIYFNPVVWNCFRTFFNYFLPFIVVQYFTVQYL